MNPSLGNAFPAQLQAVFPPARRAALGRIVLRSQAEVPYALATIGTGAPITVKRAMAVKLALEGSELPAIAQTTGLSEPRVGQVLRNVLEHGLPALYPAFPEDVPLPASLNESQLWRLIRPIIESSPSSKDVRASRWNPALVLEYLIVQKTLEDGSASQIEAVIKRYLDPKANLITFQYHDSGHIQPSEKSTFWGYFFFVVAGIGLIALGVGTHSVSALLFGSIMTLLMTTLFFKQLLEYRLLRRVLAQSGKTSALPVTPSPQLSRLSNPTPVPPPPLTILHANSLPSTPWKIDAITDTANALGLPPMRILYLWVFAAQSAQNGFETEGWPQLGSVHLLLNATALRIGQLMGDLDKLLVSNQETLDATIRAYTDQSGTYERLMLFMTGKIGKYTYRGYPIHTLVCNDAVWKPAVHQLAARCDLAVVNLSGYNPSHPGLEYEIHHLLSGGPPSRFLFLYERHTDADAVITSVLALWDDVWSHLEATPAIVPELLFLRVPDSQDIGYALQFRKPARGFGWLTNSLAKHEGEYTPIAARIVAYLNSRQAERIAS